MSSIPSRHIPSEDGLVAADWRLDRRSGWQVNWLVMGKGDTLPPPDKKARYGESESGGLETDEESEGQYESAKKGLGGTGLDDSQIHVASRLRWIKA